MPLGLIRKVFRPTIVDRVDVWRYVGSVTLLAWIVAIGIDVADRIANHTVWSRILTEEALSTFSVLVIAIPVARSMGIAHLELHRAKKEAERLGRTDSLTGLANRRAFYEAAVELGAHGAVALAIADLDRFKRINDSVGHAAGDETLRTVARLMESELADLGLVARIGGEEFALIADGRPPDEIAARLEKFRERVASHPIATPNGNIHATVSVGFAVSRGGGFDQLYAAADRALYIAKSAGRDRVVNGDHVEAIIPTAPIRQAS
jgi:diguanylate cyclase (GGDEF)-like protein